MSTTVGQRIEDLHCYGFAEGEKLTPDERAQMLEYARSFEECTYSREELVAMDDKHLVAAGYGAMADYARGQV